MAVPSGTRLAQYEVREQIGAGGMGEVYLARDTKLQRDVALKILPEQFAHDPERLARFRREAQLLASLNHPNIATIYGLEDANGSHFLAMEYVSGETLQQRIQHSGPVPMDEALGIMTQICEALEHAHEKGIIHRDLKPANVKLTPEGKVKVLDFGLAKAFSADSSADLPLDSNSPTVAPRPAGASPTIPGMILGTAAYMSPEQAKGKTVDRRTDIWALGCVVYELLTGMAAFTGESVTEILGGVMRGEPDWSMLPADTLPAVRAVLRRCLQKDASKRLRSAADVGLALEDAGTASVAASQATNVSVRTSIRSAHWIGIALVASSITGLAVWKWKPENAPASLPVSRTMITQPANEQLVTTNIQQSIVAISPDGRSLAYTATGGPGVRRLYIRPLDSVQSRPLADTDSGGPVFSPDGEWLAFFASGRLCKVSTAGGSISTLASATDPRGVTWGPGGTLVFASGNFQGLWQVSAAGGAPHAITKVETGEAGHRWPEFIPGTNIVLFTITNGPNPDDSQIAALNLDTGERKVILPGGTYGRYAATGHLIYYRAGAIMGASFDVKRLEVTGPGVPLIENVRAGESASGGAHFSFSQQGSLVYVEGPGGGVAKNTLVWVDRHGREEALAAPPHAYGYPRISPDGRLVGLTLLDPKSDVWIYDLARDTLTRLTFEGINSNSNWSPDGKRVVFVSNKDGPTNLYWKLVDGSVPEERLLTSENVQNPGSFTPDGKTFLYTEINPQTGRDIWLLPLDGDRKPQPLLLTTNNETMARLSPDGRWLSYVSDESGHYELYIRPFPGTAKWQISTEGASEQTWSPKGNELFFRAGDHLQKMMAVDVQFTPTFTLGKPHVLFEGNYARNTTPGAFYSVSPDAQRFLMLKPMEAQVSAPTQINVVLNWFEELKQKVPLK